MALRLSAVALAVMLALPQMAAAAREPSQSFSADYAVSIFGFTVARSTVVSRIGASDYKVDGSIKSSGLATFFGRTTATTSASGRIVNGRMTPDRYSVDYVYGDKSKKTELQFARGNVVKIVNSPALPPRRADWVPLGAGELLAVADPLSAVLIEAKDLRSVCGRTLKAFDGAIRANLALSYVDSAPVSIDGYRGEAVTCRGRFVPVAGYHRGNRSLQYLSQKSRIMLKFAQLGKTGILRRSRRRSAPRSAP